MSENVSGGLWSLVGPVGGSVLGLVGSLVAGFEPPVAAALVAGVAGLGGAVVNGLLASRLQRQQAAQAKGLADQQRGHDKELAALRSELRGVEREAEQLRAHSLGLEAERRKAFEAKRAEVSAEIYSMCARCYARLLEFEEHIETLVNEGFDPSELEHRTSPASEAADSLLNLIEHGALGAALYLSDAALEELTAFVRAGRDASETAIAADVRTHLHALKRVLRPDVGGPARTPDQTADNSDDTAP